jgi:hypothetical protein
VPTEQSRRIRHRNRRHGRGSGRNAARNAQRDTARRLRWHAQRRWNSARCSCRSSRSRSRRSSSGRRNTRQNSLQMRANTRRGRRGSTPRGLRRSSCPWIHCSSLVSQRSSSPRGRHQPPRREPQGRGGEMRPRMVRATRRAKGRVVAGGGRSTRRSGLPSVRLPSTPQGLPSPRHAKPAERVSLRTRSCWTLAAPRRGLIYINRRRWWARPLKRASKHTWTKHRPK